MGQTARGSGVKAELVDDLPGGEIGEAAAVEPQNRQQRKVADQ